MRLVRDGGLFKDSVPLNSPIGGGYKFIVLTTEEKGIVQKDVDLYRRLRACTTDGLFWHGDEIEPPQPAEGVKAIAAHEKAEFAALCGRYMQRQDTRQREMGLQYTTAETHELSRYIAGRIVANSAPAHEREAELGGAMQHMLDTLERKDLTSASRIEAMKRQLKAALRR